MGPNNQKGCARWCKEKDGRHALFSWNTANNGSCYCFLTCPELYPSQPQAGWTTFAIGDAKCPQKEKPFSGSSIDGEESSVAMPSVAPSIAPTLSESEEPSSAPTFHETNEPSSSPTIPDTEELMSESPSAAPSSVPSASPSSAPSTDHSSENEDEDGVGVARKHLRGRRF
ncbi:MAG: hypothetical protein SGARI_000522 [Bacillariaceae sp.]